MRKILMKSAGVACAFAIGASAGACSRGETPELYAGNTKSSERVASKANAEAAAVAKAKAAEARAAAAEARIRCEKERQEASNQGAVVGGLTGAVIGSQVAGKGAKTEGGVLGGTVGVLTGRQIAKKDHRC